MALGTYDDLVTAVATWAMRTGDTEFEAAIPDFVTLVEDMLNFGTDDMPPLRTRDMEGSTSLTLVDGAADLPADYLEYRTMEYGSAPYTLLSSDFTIVGNEFRTTRTGVSPVAMGYYARIPALGPSNQTNWLIDRNSQVYLFGSLLMAAPFMMDDPRVATWGTLFNKAVAGVSNTDFRSKYIRGSVRTAGYTP